MRREKSLPISAVFAQFINDNGLAEGLLRIDVLHAWDSVIGERMTKYVLARNFYNGKLICTLSSSSAKSAISMNKSAYIKKINEELGREIVQEIILN